MSKEPNRNLGHNALFDVINQYITSTDECKKLQEKFPEDQDGERPEEYWSELSRMSKEITLHTAQMFDPV